MSYAISVFAVYVTEKAVPSDAKSAAVDISKLLFSGSFLIGTILSLSVAVPGQALIKVLLNKDPEYAVDFVVPFMWSFMWGIIGGAALLVFHSKYLLVPLRPVAVVLASYGACMLVHAITHAIRKYLLGLVIKSGEE